MIEFNHKQQLAGNGSEQVLIKVVGLGGAGLNVIDRIVLDGAVPGADLVVMNTDVQALTSSVASQKVQLGRGVTRGLGAGGDPEIGFNAASEAQEEIRKALEGASLVFICAGLGGGTGSGAAPFIASMAKENGSLVIVIATIPFTFEGNAGPPRPAMRLSCFRPRRTPSFVSTMISWAMLSPRRPAFIRPSLPPMKPSHKSCVPSRGSSSNLASFISALMIFAPRCVPAPAAPAAASSATGRRTVTTGRTKPWLALCGTRSWTGAGCSMNATTSWLTSPEVRTCRSMRCRLLMEALSKHLGEQSQILFGASVDPNLNGRVAVTIISSAGIAAPSAAAGAPGPEFVPRVVPAPVLAPVVRAPAGPAARQPVEEDEPAHISPNGHPEEDATLIVADRELTAAYAPPDSGDDQQASLLEVHPRASRRRSQSRAVPCASGTPPTSHPICGH